MNNKLKIKVSEAAFIELHSRLNNNKEYTHIRLSYKDGCCGSSKIEVVLDKPKENDITDSIEDLYMLYDKEVLENVKEITLVYRNSSFMIKTILKEHKKKSCSTCNSSCHKGSCKTQ